MRRCPFVIWTGATVTLSSSPEGSAPVSSIPSVVSISFTSMGGGMGQLQPGALPTLPWGGIDP